MNGQPCVVLRFPPRLVHVKAPVIQHCRICATPFGGQTVRETDDQIIQHHREQHQADVPLGAA